MFDMLKKSMENTKKVILTISFIVASITGGYTIVSEHFVTRTYADDLVLNVENKISELRKQTTDNKRILIEMRLIRMEEKLGRGEELTPTEKRIYDRLKKEYENVIE